ncbi:MAG TPA: hypothetical protein PLY42_13210 [Nitrospira sp.]|nr:hypothetical protein [Nitrospira sp.]
MSDYPTSINLCDGKYTIIYDFATGQSECLRYGQPWRQLVGDKMVLACFDEIVRLRAELAAAQLEAKAQECERLAEVFEPGWIKNMLDREAAAHRARKQTKEEGK